MRCSACAKGAMIEIKMHVGGSELKFRRCGRCESQSWESEEGHIPLTRVLELARTH